MTDITLGGIQRRLMRLMAIFGLAGLIIYGLQIPHPKYIQLLVISPSVAWLALVFYVIFVRGILYTVITGERYGEETGPPLIP